MKNDAFDNYNAKADNPADKTAKEIILDVKRILDKHDVHFFPMFGTLLGFVRDKGVIAHDTDADLATWHTNYDKIRDLEDEFLANGYVMGGSGLKYKYRYLSLTPINNNRFGVDMLFLIKDIDCYVFSRFPDNNFLERIMKKYNLTNNRLLLWINRRVRMLLFRNTMRYAFPAEWFDKQTQHVIYDTAFYLPENVIEYLTTIYGDDWRTPTKKWNKKIAIKQGKRNGIFRKYKIKGDELRNILYYREVA